MPSPAPNHLAIGVFNLFLDYGYAGQAVLSSNLKPYDLKIPVCVESVYPSSKRALAVVVCHP